MLLKSHVLKYFENNYVMFNMLFLNFTKLAAQRQVQPGIFTDKPIDDKLIYIPNYDKQIVPIIK